MCKGMARTKNDLATAWLLDKKVLLPGVTTLTRLISSVRERVAERLWQRASAVVTPEQRTDLEGHKHPDLIDAPMEVVPASWKRHVAPKDQPVDRRYYTLCVLERLHEALRCHDVFVEESTRWGDPRAKLLTGEHWERVRPTICQSLGRKAEPKQVGREGLTDVCFGSACSSR